MADQAKCRSCGAEIFWVTMMPSGKKNPLDATPVANGNVRVLADGKAETMKETERMLWEGPKYLSHFATCPSAAQHRKPR